MKKYFTLISFICFAVLKLTSINAQTVEVYSNNKEANANYLKALEYIKIGNPRTGGSVDSLVIATQLLEKAVVADSLFIRAYIELSNTYWMFDYSYPNSEKYESMVMQILPKAKSVIAKALKADSTSSAAYTALARMNLNYEYKWDEALQNFAKAIHYDSSIASNYSYYGQTLALKGKWETAQQWIDKANTKGPNDNRVLLTSGIYYNWKRDYVKADAALQKINPQNVTSHFFTGLNHLNAGKTDKALTILKKLYDDYEQYDGGSKALLAYALVENGQMEEGRKLLNRSYELKQSVNYRAAACFVALKEYSKAIKLLEECFNQHGNWMIWLKYDKAWDPIRNKKRFKQLIDKMRFDM